jgi:acyl transferase domain-containing protein/acyl carrier protein
MGCRLPGGIDSADALWESLLRGEDLVTEVPLERWDADEYYDPEVGVPGRTVSRWGGFIDDIAGFDLEFFGIGEREAIAIDPQHRLLLETAWEAIEHGGLDPASLAGSKTAVFMGLSTEDYLLLTSGAGALAGPHAVTGVYNSVASGRIAYALGLHGPAMTVDTACSSGLMTVHLGCRSLAEGESDLVLAGGCQVLLEPASSVSASAQGMLSPTGRCHSFDADADGFVRSEGCAVVLLKRLPDALRDGDRILAVIRGTAANQNGRSDTLTMPNEDAQVEVFRAALAAAGVEPETVGAVEAHGTGTPVGDPIEYRSLARVYGGDGSRCLLGSAKSNLGHSESASGTVGLIKAIMSLRHGVVPPMVHFNKLPEDLAAIETGLAVPQEVTPWSGSGDGAPRRVGVNSFGVSGTNVHAIVEEAPAEALAQAPESATGSPESVATGPQLFALSATSPEALRATAHKLAGWVESRTDSLSLPDLAYTLARRRAHRPVRTMVAAASLPELVEGLREVADGSSNTALYEPAVGQGDRGPVWVFSGQGSQWAAMGAQLLAGEPVFAETVAALEPVISAESGFSVTEAMTAPQTVTGIDKVQPTIFAMQVALAATMERSYGVRPGAVIGHSLGESAAAVVAGALSLEDGARVICRRSKLMCRIAGGGAMASVELPVKQVYSELMVRGVDDVVVVSVVASPQSTVIGGDPDTVRDLVARWEKRDVMAREVAVDVASHSPHVDPILDDLAAALVDIVPTPPKVPYYSATLFDPREQPVCDGGYWVDNLRQTVQFSAAVQAALEDGYRVFAELSPHPLLTHAVEQNARSLDMSVAALASMRREQALATGLRGFLSDLHSVGAAVDFSVLHPAGRLVDVPLPQWTHRHLFLDNDDQDHKAQGASTISVHPLLGSYVRLMEEPQRHIWQTDVGTVSLPWLGDYQVDDQATLPWTAYCEMALAAASEVFGQASEVRDIAFERALPLDEHTPIEAVASVDAPGVVDFVLASNLEDVRTRHATANLRAAEDNSPPSAYDIAALLEAHPCILNGAELRESFVERGVQHGPAFGGLVTVRTKETAGGSALAEVGLPASIRFQQGAYQVHPALLDACFQSVAVGVESGAGAGPLLPLSVRRLRTYGPARNARYCYTRLLRSDSTGCEADLDLLDESGTVLLTVRGLRMGSGATEAGERDRIFSERLLTLAWQQRELPEAVHGEAGSWLLVDTSDAEDLLAGSLTDALKSQGAECANMHWTREADLATNAESFRAQLRGSVGGVVILCGPGAGEPDEQILRQGREQVRHLVRIIRELADLDGELPRLYVVTRQAQKVHSDDQINLEHGGLRGLLRVIGSEHPLLHTTQVDVDEHTEPEQLAQQLLGGSPEDETAWRNGQWYTARLCPSPLSDDERRTAIVDHEHDNMQLQVRTPGDLQTLEYLACDRVSPRPGQIEVAVRMSSVNFADVRTAFGAFPVIDDRQPRLGMDFVGVVSAVGDGVADHRVGDRVGGFSATGCWRSFLTVDANLAVALPQGLADEQAAAAATALATAWYGLHDLAGIKAGDRVLIHSATGGVGQAAIAVARRAGAQIFATAGSPERRKMLQDMGIERVYDSRSIEFAERIRRDTKGYGVDIVLNSLTGAAQRAGLELLAFGGRFVEIGNADVLGNSRLGLYSFRRGLTFHYVDLAQMSIVAPDRIHQLLATVFKLIADGELAAPRATHYPFADAANAIRAMSSAEHTGKLLLDMPRSGRSGVVVPADQARVFRRDGAYIVTGGLGGLGLFFATKMAGAGCGRIVLTARSQPNPKARKMIERLRAGGTDIVVECGNIAEPDTGERLVTAATADGMALRGVLHAAAVVEDATLTNITDELIDRDWSPKAYGSWNLHRATSGQSLDWFCVFSSAAALLGSPGQGAYAAANSWVDAFVQWRRAQGLPASAIAWGAWAEVGRATSLAEGGEIMITPDEGMYAFETLLRYDRTYSGYIPIIGAPWLPDLIRRSPFAEMFSSAEQSAKGSSKFRAELRLLPQDEWPARLRRMIATQAGAILRRTLDADRPFIEYGLDSLGMLEMRTHIEAETGILIGPKVLATHNTVRALAQHLSDTLAEEEDAAPAEAS